MATIHVYVRQQLRGSNAEVEAIAAAVDALRAQITAAGGEARAVSVRIELDPPAAPRDGGCFSRREIPAA